MKLRILKLSDNCKYLSLMNQFRETNVNITNEEFNQLYRKIFSNGFILVCEYNNNLVASLSVYIEQKFIHNFAKYAHIEDVFVSEIYRNKRIGLLLLEDAISRCEKLGVYKIVLHCDKDLVKYYEKKNFELGGVMMSFKIESNL